MSATTNFNLTNNMRPVSGDLFWSYVGNFRYCSGINFLNIDGHSALRFYHTRNDARHGILIQSNPPQYFLPPRRDNNTQ